MERKKVLVLKENQVLEIDLKRWREKKFWFKENQVLKIDLQEMERKKVLVLKENQVFKKKRFKPSGFTNNPKYFGKKPSENLF